MVHFRSEELLARPNDTRMPGELKVSAVEALIKPWCRGIFWLVERSVGRDGAWGSGALAGGEWEILGPVNLLRRIRESRVYVPLFGRRKLRSVIMAREQAELWKTRDNGGKAAWLFIGVLSSVYWVSDVITDDELAVLIMRACSSRNLFVKHHILKRVMLAVFSASAVSLNEDINTWTTSPELLAESLDEHLTVSFE